MAAARGCGGDQGSRYIGDYIGDHMAAFEDDLVVQVRPVLDDFFAGLPHSWTQRLRRLLRIGHFESSHPDWAELLRAAAAPLP